MFNAVNVSKVNEMDGKNIVDPKQVFDEDPQDDRLMHTYSGASYKNLSGSWCQRR